MPCEALGNMGSGSAVATTSTSECARLAACRFLVLFSYRTEERCAVATGMLMRAG